MQKQAIVFVLTVSFAGLLVSQIFAAQAKAAEEICKDKKLKHADKNKDGSIDKKEMHMEKKCGEKQSSKVNTWWEKRADTNSDGKVDKDELAAWKNLEKTRIDLNNDGQIDAKEKRLCWRHARLCVNTTVEKKYDTNGDGWLEAEEVKSMLKNKLTIIKTQGKAKVDSETEKAYDGNNDGVIDTKEAEALKEDIK